MSRTVRFAAPVETVFIEEGFDPAYFVSLPTDASERIAAICLGDGGRRAFGSVRVEATIGGSTWKTSLNARGSGWTLPIKKPVRLAEAIEEGALVNVVLAVQ